MRVTTELGPGVYRKLRGSLTLSLFMVYFFFPVLFGVSGCPLEFL